jgi:hypothetical protein
MYSKLATLLTVGGSRAMTEIDLYQAIKFLSLAKVLNMAAWRVA